MTIDTQPDEAGGPGPDGTAAVGSATRRRILQLALTLMSQRGVDGTSMRDLASAAGLNVASLYHYFPSKRDLLDAVLVEQGTQVRATWPPGEPQRPAEVDLTDLLGGILASMFEVEDFVRLMMGEAIRGDATARHVGLELFTSFGDSIEDWVTRKRPDLAESAGALEVSHLLSAMVLGVFVQHAAGMIPAEDLNALSRERAREVADILRPTTGKA